MAFSLEAKRQLYAKIILVMATNSLYLSIIHEYKIDFTTVHQTKFVLILGFSQTRFDTDRGEEQIQTLPSPDLELGVLPRLIAELANRRKRVEAMLKDKNAPGQAYAGM